MTQDCTEQPDIVRKTFIDKHEHAVSTTIVCSDPRADVIGRLQSFGDPGLLYQSIRSREISIFAFARSYLRAGTLPSSGKSGVNLYVPSMAVQRIRPRYE